LRVETAGMILAVPAGIEFVLGLGMIFLEIVAEMLAAVGCWLYQAGSD